MAPSISNQIQYFNQFWIALKSGNSNGIATIGTFDISIDCEKKYSYIANTSVYTWTTFLIAVEFFRFFFNFSEWNNKKNSTAFIFN